MTATAPGGLPHDAPVTPSAASAGPDVVTQPGPDLDRCALEGCDLPVPARALDEQGRPKGGRRPQYCGKAHTDAASRQRRVREVASVVDPLALARIAGEVFLPGARQLAGQLGELISRFDQAEAGALARVLAAEQEAGQALAEATLAREAADTAEQARRQAVAQARQDRQARDNAIGEAGRARAEAERVRTGAWEQVAVHERARGQAEAARAAAETAADGLIGQNRELREQVEQARSGVRQLGEQIVAAGQDLERSRGESLALLARVEALEHTGSQDRERARSELMALREQLSQSRQHAADLGTELATERTRVAERTRTAERAHEQLTAVRERTDKQLTSLSAALEAERAAHRLDRELLVRVRLAQRARLRHERTLQTRTARPDTPDPPA